MNEAANILGWQQDFIATNLLAIGYNAWAGYLNGERGAIICSTSSPAVGIAGETFKTHSVPRSRFAAFLNAWLAAPDTVILRHHFMNAHILDAVDTYNPATAAVFLLESFNQVTFFYTEKSIHYTTSMLRTGLQRVGRISTANNTMQSRINTAKLMQLKQIDERMQPCVESGDVA